MSGLIRFDRIRTIHRLIRIEACREILYIIEAKEEREDDDRSERKEHGRNATSGS